ncbi:N-substituted formamide deformylase [Nocardioides aquaticus]|uniref:N-substituted formamide deformylase n=1 Tax=Nocardioides aquaticus TaxID=160826 RepID=A0ABX8EJ09_9ACTN|nr:amidohydrolase [Nocardioides aquaticus]QVT79052.1 N-substituted formamide deformylase [Nocardioides aquaticus]
MRDLVIRGGRVFDGHRLRGPGTVVVRGTRIAALLGPGEPQQWPRGAEVVEAGGGLVLPGLVDAHVHAVQGGLERIRCDLTAHTDRAGTLAAVAAYAAAHPDLPWLLGGGWSMSAFPGGTPTAADLDAVVGDRPVFLPNRDHHGAWVSSRALAMAGIDEHTPDPPDGRIERDDRGRPTGTLHEGAMALVSRLVPPTTEAECDAALLAGQAYLHSLGVTGWQDAIVGDYAGLDDPGPAYRRAAERGDLTAHVVGALWWDRERGVEQLPDLLARRGSCSYGRFRATSVKVMQDGVAENGTAALGAPYLDRCGHATANRGHSFVDPAALREAVVALDAAGFQVHVHAIGDRGVREALDAFADVPVGRRGVGRHHVAHLQMVDPVDLPRFAELGVAANAQALWACLDEQMTQLTLPYVGAERARWQYPFGALVRHGARLVMGSDWPVSSPAPFEAIHTAVNRTSYGEHGRGGTEAFLPEHAVDLVTALAAYTSGSAWINGREAEVGTLAPGREADLVVLDRDPFAGPVAEIGAAQVVGTWVAGERVFGS